MFDLVCTLYCVIISYLIVRLFVKEWESSKGLVDALKSLFAMLTCSGTGLQSENGRPLHIAAGTVVDVTKMIGCCIKHRAQREE